VYTPVWTSGWSWDPHGGEGAAIHIGHDGPDLTLDFADTESMELLSSVAAEGVRQMRERAPR
jgi:hypothetical protein